MHTTVLIYERGKGQCQKLSLGQAFEEDPLYPIKTAKALSRDVRYDSQSFKKPLSVNKWEESIP